MFAATKHVCQLAALLRHCRCIGAVQNDDRLAAVVGDRVGDGAKQQLRQGSAPEARMDTMGQQCLNVWFKTTIAAEMCAIYIGAPPL